MKLTKEQIKELNYVPTFEIKKDIKDTQAEIDDYEAVNKILRNNPVKNKVGIYLNEGSILKRKEFIEKLNCILQYRGES